MMVHPALALGKLTFRSTLKMPVWESVQILFGISIPALMIPHLVHTRIAYQAIAYDDAYRNVLAAIWPESGCLPEPLDILIIPHARDLPHQGSS
jgi:adenylate cyclase